VNRTFSRRAGRHALELRAATFDAVTARARNLGASALTLLAFVLVALLVAAGFADAAGSGSEANETSSASVGAPPEAAALGGVEGSAAANATGSAASEGNGAVIEGGVVAAQAEGQLESNAASALVAAASKASCTPEFGSFSIGHWPPACWHPYGPSSPFNTPIPANPTLAPESAAIVKYIKRHHWLFQNEGGNFDIHAHGSRPVYWAQSTDPLIKVSCTGGYPCNPGTVLRIPAGAQPEDEWDEHMTVVEQAEGLEYDFWRASKPEKGEMTASSEGSIPIGAGSGTGLGGVAEAADLGLLGGLIRAPELAAGNIEHALGIITPRRLAIPVLG
jgi:hypothetical protein